MTVIGVSLKAYFGHARALAWCRQAVRLAQAHAGATDVFVLPSFPALPAAAEIFAGTGVGLGAQNLCATDDGASTGEVTGAMLAEIGCRYAEIGHAERRTRYGETDAVVAEKVAAARRHGLMPVLCVGETEHLPTGAAIDECRRQIDAALSATDAAGPLIVAYEPHWAIGAARPAPEQHIAQVCSAVRTSTPGARVIYGGSAGPGLLSRLGDAVDGLFLGRFAHDPLAFAGVLDEAADRRFREPAS